jgi:hypothetical protein
MSRRDALKYAAATPALIGLVSAAESLRAPSASADGLGVHTAAGGPANVPIYASIDDDPSFEQYQAQVAPYLRGWESVVGHQRTGVYGNSKTTEWALHDGLGSYFWRHNWGSPGGRTHPAAHLHQVEIDKRHVAGVGVDINNICKPQFGQWA